MTYLYLLIAIMAEVLATSTLKATAQFSRPLPSLFVAAGYACSFYFLSLVLGSMPVGIAYAIWSGLGIVLVAVLATFLYRQAPDWPAVAGMGMIIGGVVVINLFSKTVGH